jgi:hypothetical protein
MNEDKFWLIGLGVCVVLVLLLRFALIRGVIGRWLRPVGERLAEWVNPPPPFDPVADDLAKALRRERLQADVRRLQHLLATDEWMSATRQMGNRLAYDWLVRELDRNTRSISPLFVSDDTYGNSDIPEVGEPISPRARSQPAQRSPQVEILEIGGWRGAGSRR